MLWLVVALGTALVSLTPILLHQSDWATTGPRGQVLMIADNVCARNTTAGAANWDTVYWGGMTCCPTAPSCSSFCVPRNALSVCAVYDQNNSIVRELYGVDDREQGCAWMRSLIPLAAATWTLMLMQLLFYCCFVCCCCYGERRACNPELYCLCCRGSPSKWLVALYAMTVIMFIASLVSALYTLVHLNSFLAAVCASVGSSAPRSSAADASLYRSLLCIADEDTRPLRFGGSGATAAFCILGLWTLTSLFMTMLTRMCEKAEWNPRWQAIAIARPRVTIGN